MVEISNMVFMLVAMVDLYARMAQLKKLRLDATRSVERKPRIYAAMNVTHYHVIAYDTEGIMDMRFSHACG